MQESPRASNSLRRKASLIFAAVFVAMLFAVPVVTLCLPQSLVSQIENRTLAELPEASWKSLVSGVFFADCETCFQDHIVGRDLMLMGHTWLELHVAARTIVNGIIPTDDCLLPELSPSDEAHEETAARAERMAERLLALQNAVQAYGGTFLYVIVPTQMTAFADAYPADLYSGSESRTLAVNTFERALAARQIACLRMQPVFEQAGGMQQFYMRTDHHYTLKGAFLVYQTMMEQLQVLDVTRTMPVLTDADLVFSKVSATFRGSRSRSIYYLTDLQDDFWTYALQQPIPYTRMDNGVSTDAPVIALPEDSAASVTYSAYMGGDVAETILQTNRPELPNILIFGDSYTNAVETFLYTSFNETRSLDLRHNASLSILNYVQAFQPDFVICLRDDANILTESGNGRVQ